MVKLEEERFGNTLTVGLKKLEELIQNYRSQKIDFSNVSADRPVANRWAMPSAKEIARLNDTYGLPIDLAYAVLATESVEIQLDIIVDGCRNVDKRRVENLTEEEFRQLISEAVKQIQQSSEIKTR